MSYAIVTVNPLQPQDRKGKECSGQGCISRAGWGISWAGGGTVVTVEAETEKNFLLSTHNEQSTMVGGLYRLSPLKRWGNWSSERANGFLGHTACEDAEHQNRDLTPRSSDAKAPDSGSCLVLHRLPNEWEMHTGMGGVPGILAETFALLATELSQDQYPSAQGSAWLKREPAEDIPGI